MKLESISIRDFRGIERLDLDFRDELGLIRDVIPIVGPNTSGKTTILDAITICLRQMSRDREVRPDLRWHPSSLVRSGAVRAEITANLWFSDDEIEATREVLARSEAKGHMPLPSEGRVQVRWTYPHPELKWGDYQWEPAEGAMLPLGRYYLAPYLHVPGLGPRLFRRLGGVFLFDQNRTGLADWLSGGERAQLGHLLDPQGLAGDVHGNGRGEPEIGRVPMTGGARPFHTKNPRLLLTSLAMRASVAQDPNATEQEDFAQLKKLYEHVCQPHTMGELFNTEDGLDIEFHGPQGPYSYDGLSSGQQMILLMLLQFATRRIHRSIVLIDELELHLHPLWQDRLYLALPRLGDDNQYFFTTHSTHIRDTLSDGFCYMTGKLAEPAVMR